MRPGDGSAKAIALHAAVIAALFALNFFGDGLRDAADPYK